MYFDTDRKMYRPGDRVNYRFFSRDPQSSTFAGVVGGSFWYSAPVHTTQHVTTGSFALPTDAVPGFWRSGGFSVASMRSRYELEVAALTPVVSPGSTAHFVLSGTLLDGSAAAGVIVRYGWHGTHMPEFVPLQDRAYGTNGSSPGDLTYESVTLDSQGNALLDAPVDSLDVELYVFDPDTQELTTSARAVVRSEPNELKIIAPFAQFGAGCIPIAARETTLKDFPEPNRRVHLEIEERFRHPGGQSPPPILDQELVTNSDGYVIARWCARESTDIIYVVTATDDAGVKDSAWLTATPPYPRMRYNLALLSAKTPRILPGRHARFSASSTSDSDALVFYGSDYLFYAGSAHFTNGTSRISVPAPKELDDFKVAVSQPTANGQIWAYTTISTAHKQHLLSVRLGCISNQDAICVQVSDWKNTGVRARAFIGISATTEAGIVNALERSNAVYDALYAPSRLDYSFETTWLSASNPEESYLYPPSEPQAMIVKPNVQPKPTPTVTPPRASASQTVFWMDGAETNRYGSLTIPLHNQLKPKRLWLVHVITLGPHGEIGEKFAWFYR
jgi:hypothetical protein